MLLTRGVRRGMSPMPPFTYFVQTPTSALKMANPGYLSGRPLRLLRLPEMPSAPGITYIASHPLTEYETELIAGQPNFRPEQHLIFSPVLAYIGVEP